MISILRFYIKILQPLFPDVISRKMYNVMSTPKNRPSKKYKQAILKHSKQSVISIENFSLKKFEWAGVNGKTILLVHGWEGETTNFYYLIEGLNNLGYTIVSLDAPAHGFSSKGLTHMFHFSDILEQQMTFLNPDIIMSHSFGSMNIAKALQKHTTMPIALWIMISTPLTFRLGFKGQSEKYGINTSVQNTLIKRVENDTKDAFDNLSMIKYCSTIKNIKKITIVQSTSDQVFPMAWALELEKLIQTITLIQLEGLNHYKILHSESLMKVITDEL